MNRAERRGGKMNNFLIFRPNVSGHYRNDKPPPTKEGLEEEEAERWGQENNLVYVSAPMFLP